MPITKQAGLAGVHSGAPPLGVATKGGAQPGVEGRGDSWKEGPESSPGPT